MKLKRAESVIVLLLTLLIVLLRSSMKSEGELRGRKVRRGREWEEGGECGAWSNADLVVLLNLP